MESKLDGEFQNDLEAKVINFCENMDLCILKKKVDRKNLCLQKDTLQFESLVEQYSKLDPKIPKIIHQIWFGSKMPPDNWMHSWRHDYLKKYPEWSYKLWTEKDLNSINMINQDIFNKTNRFDGKSDIIRYEILYQFGGIYIDSDCVWVGTKNLNELTINAKNTGFFIAHEPNKWWLANGVMGCSPGHPYLMFLIHALRKNLSRMPDRGSQPWKITGPLLTGSLINNNFKHLTIIPHELFYPFHWNKTMGKIMDVKNYPNSFMIHYGYTTMERLLAKKLEVFFRQITRQNRNLYFMNIGAMDGFRHDLIRRHILRLGWRGVFVEPLPDMFAKLKKNFHSVRRRIRFENSAIHNTKQQKTMYRIPAHLAGKNGIPGWVDGISSMFTNRNAIGGNNGLLWNKKLDPSLYDTFKDQIVEEKVQCITFNDLIEKHKIRKIDILQIDTEGCDWIIFKQIDLEKFRPIYICIEICNLPQNEYNEIIKKLEKYEYKHFHTTQDLFAIQPDYVKIAGFNKKPFNL